MGRWGFGFGCVCGVWGGVCAKGSVSGGMILEATANNLRWGEGS